MKNKSQTVLCLAVALLVNHSAFAANSDNSAIELQKLKDRLAILEKRISEKNSAEKSDDDVIVKLKPTPSFKTRDGKSSFFIDGRIQVDAGAVTKGKTSAMNNGTSLRRLWLGAGGDVNENWNYRFLVGFENNQTSIYDAFVRYHGFKNTDILIGNFFENNGIDIASGNLVTPLMERSSGITTFRQFRRTGVSINHYIDNLSLHFGVFGSSPSNSTTSAINANNKGNGFSGRAHIAAINDAKNSEFLHLGFNSTYRTLDSGSSAVTGSNKTMRFNSTGDANVLNTILIDTGNIANVNNYYQNMGEFRYQKGSLTITSEYIRTTLNRAAAQKLNFSGGYLMASYFLTGEKYGYDSKMGVQTLPSIGNKGAWEIASRYSMTDLNSKTVAGGKLNSYDFGVNYYPNNNLKFMVNYVFNRTDSAAQIKNNPQYLMMRMQLNF